MSKKQQIYRVVFLNQGQVFEIYVGQVYQSNLYGFLEVEGFLFGERTQVVDPSEERLKNQFAGVQRSFIPINVTIRIDEKEKKRGARCR